MRKIIAFLAAFIVMTTLSAALVGCGDKTSDESGNPSSSGNANVKYNIVLSATELEIELGESEILVASCGNKTLTFISSDSSVATVAEDGKITAAAVGTAYIRVSAGEQEKICKVTVVKNEWTIRIDCESSITAVNSINKEFTATVYKNGEKTMETVAWTISGGAELFTDGNLTRVYTEKTGTYTLTAKYKKAVATVTIAVISK